MRHVTIISAFVASLFLVACAGLGEIEDPQAARDASMFATCEAFTSTMRTMNTFEPVMSEGQKEVIDSAVIVIQPACHAARAGVDTTEDILNAVRDALREITRIQLEMEQ
jgi:hypothetical protein